MLIKCCICGRERDVLDREYRRQVKAGRTWFACSKECALKYRVISRKIWTRPSRYTIGVDLQQDKEAFSYILGFICGDGTVSLRDTREGIRVHSIVLLSTDREILEKIKERISYTAPVLISKKGSEKYKECYSLSFYHNNAEIWYNAGAVKNKDDWSLKDLKITDIRAFLRGFIDADGTIRSDGRVCVSILGRRRIINDLSVLLKEYAFLLREDSVVRFNIKLYHLYLFGLNKVKPFLKWLYEGSTLFMERKYIKANEILNT